MAGRRTQREGPEPGISREVVAPVIDALSSLGLDARSLVPALDEAADTVVAGTRADDLLETAARRLGIESLGLELALRMPIGALGLLDYALSTSATVRDAFRRVTSHYSLVSQRVTVRLVESEQTASLVFSRDPKLSHSRHWLEFSIAFLATRIRQTVQRDVIFDEVRFAHSPPKDRHPYDAFFGTEVRFEAAQDRVSFARGLLDAPLRTASTALAELLDIKIRELEPERSSDPFVDRVRSEIGQLLEQRDVQLDTLSTRLHMTRRTLQRELSRRDLSHKMLLDDIRRQKASKLLGEALTLTEVAERLAYSEPSAFFRAYRRWTGTSPRAGASSSVDRSS